MKWSCLLSCAVLLSSFVGVNADEFGRFRRVSDSQPVVSDPFAASTTYGYYNTSDAGSYTDFPSYPVGYSSYRGTGYMGSCCEQAPAYTKGLWDGYCNQGDCCGTTGCGGCGFWGFGRLHCRKAVGCGKAMDCCPPAQRYCGMKKFRGGCCAPTDCCGKGDCCDTGKCCRHPGWCCYPQCGDCCGGVGATWWPRSSYGCCGMGCKKSFGFGGMWGKGYSNDCCNGSVGYESYSNGQPRELDSSDVPTPADPEAANGAAGNSELPAPAMTSPERSIDYYRQAPPRAMRDRSA